MAYSNRLAVCVSYLAYAYIHLWGRTSRFELIGRDIQAAFREGQGPFIFTFWHSRQIYPLYYFRNTGVATLVSQSRDGEYITQVIRRCGLNASRGSTSRRGSEGLREQLRWLKQGYSVAFTPDGPRGPREVVQAGVIQLARLAGLPITPAAFCGSRCIRINSWDRFMLPLPFARVRLVVGEDIHVPREADRNLIEAKRLELQNEMRRITAIADEILPPSKRV
jgi:lysophospholipid acyltransferase (LPLAT)-like uncharacterized protein